MIFFALLLIFMALSLALFVGHHEWKRRGNRWPRGSGPVFNPAWYRRCKCLTEEFSGVCPDCGYFTPAQKRQSPSVAEISPANLEAEPTADESAPAPEMSNREEHVRVEAAATTDASIHNADARDEELRAWGDRWATTEFATPLEDRSIAGVVGIERESAVITLPQRQKVGVNGHLKKVVEAIQRSVRPAEESPAPAAKTPERVMAVSQPDTVVLANSLDAIAEVNPPDLVDAANWPDAIIAVNPPDSIDAAHSREGVIAPNAPDTVVLDNRPETVVAADSADAVMTVNLPDAVVSANSPEVVTAVPPPDAVITVNPPDAVVATISPEVVIADHPPDAVLTASQTVPVDAASSPDAVSAAHLTDTVVTVIPQDAVIAVKPPGDGVAIIPPYAAAVLNLPGPVIAAGSGDRRVPPIIRLGQTDMALPRPVKFNPPRPALALSARHFNLMPMSEIKIGLIGGSGLGQLLGADVEGIRHEIDTPFGKPSDAIIETNWGGVPVFILQRHGAGHTLGPSQVPFRANIFAMKKLGVTHIIASGAVGSLREQLRPRELVIPDQIIDKTSRRAATFFEKSAVHVEFADPFCPVLRQILIEEGSKFGAHDSAQAASSNASAATTATHSAPAESAPAPSAPSSLNSEARTLSPFTVHNRGCYVCMEGPAFSTRAESHMHRLWGGDLIGMTAMPEAKLAKEAEISYALVALVTDYDCWRKAPVPKGGQPAAPLSGSELLEEIIANLKAASDNGIALIRRAVGRIAADPTLVANTPAREALKLAIWSDKTKIPRDEVELLAPLWMKYFE